MEISELKEQHTAAKQALASYLQLTGGSMDPRVAEVMTSKWVDYADSLLTRMIEGESDKLEQDLSALVVFPMKMLYLSLCEYLEEEASHPESDVVMEKFEVYKSEIRRMVGIIEERNNASQSVSG